MFRNRLKKAVQRVGRRVFSMEFEAAERQQTNAKTAPPAEVDATVIPRVQDGSGDTPGPNSKTNIGRTYASAQLLAGEGVCALDIRGPDEWAQGHLPHAMLCPESALHDVIARIPGDPSNTCVVVYDATGGADATKVAAHLRQHGFTQARDLQGGFAEWVEEGEEVLVDEPTKPFNIGDSVELSGGSSGLIWHIDAKGSEPLYSVLVQGTGASIADLSEADLKA